MSRIILRNLVKRFEKTIAVDKVSLDIADGSFVVLLGPSGCGKTTTLRCIAGLEIPDEGEIYIDNQLVNDVPPRDRDIAMVFQNYALYPHMSVYDNLAFPLKMRKYPKGEIDRLVRETARLLNIEQHLSKKPRQLSGGEQQRVALGRAIIRRPKAFLMDEPLSNLDAKLRLHMRAELKRLQKDLGITTVYVTHDQAEAMAMADKIAVMNKGKVLQYDTPDVIYNSPASVFVAGFIGTPSMNLLEGTLKLKDNKFIVDTNVFNYVLKNVDTELLKNYIGQEVTLGFRPEDMTLSKDEKEGGYDFEAEVFVIEPTGSNVIVDLKVGDYLVKCVVQRGFITEDTKRVFVKLRADRVHLFEGKSGKIIV